MLTRLCLRVLLTVALCAPVHTIAGPGDEPAGAAPPASCLLPDAGAPSCGVESAPGSSRHEPDVPHQVGNPIDVVSGNKYQYELDYQSPNSGLALARHYNSSLSDYDLGIGAGWRHSYQVVLSRVGAQRMDIVQSDGRLIRFHRAPGTQTDLFVAEQASDGFLQVGERSVWSLTDGRRLIFQGSYLVRMELGERTGALTLRYRNGKLDTVTDRQGESLSFRYVPGVPALPEYGNGQIAQPAGSLAAVQLPGGDIIQYNHGENGNLIGVRYPDGDSIGYVYADVDWPSHMTRRQSTADDRISEWQYDDQGRGIAWVEGGGINGLEIERHPVPAAEVPEDPLPEESAVATRQASVTYADGRKTEYRWKPDETAPGNGTAFISCDNCLPDASSPWWIDGSGDKPAKEDESVSLVESAAAEQGSHDSSQDIPDPGLTPMDDAVVSLLRGMTLSSDQPESEPGRTRYTGIYPHPRGDVPISMSTDRLGEVRDLKIGKTTLADIIERQFAGQLQPCFAGDYPDNTDSFSHDRIAALGHGDSPCDLDPAVVVQFEHSVKQSLKTERHGIRSKSSDGEQQGATLPFWHDMRRYCGLPAGLTCEQLEDDLDMALLSRCAYGGLSCEPAFRLVSPAEVGMSNDRFDDEGFNAELYQDPADPDRYILVFRGTDNVGDDWPNSFAQAASEKTRQYDLALNLGRDVVKELPGRQIEFSGHSLGGGLASIAALGTQRQATIFNTAALQPGTAAAYGLEDEYREADAYIRHLHTDYDPVTVLQERADELGVFHDLQTAPGRFTEIPNPDIPWVNNVHAQAESFGEGFFPLIWHSMNAVIHVLESLKEFNCSP
ncbi:DUF6531 domain-containing protein [Granulosicoccus sp. 3-233]|uniref:DUF6531 domain-containing protein n=1 Tax=Granulosicoccus sp. 3-233 TaxID=3417969 RepID=UPI003D353206